MAFLRRVLTALALAASSSVAPCADDVPETVRFPAADGTMLVGYLFAPPGRVVRAPAVVMMHGRGGAYSSLAGGRFGAETLSRRHVHWGRHWSGLGYVALLVDGFGPRGYPEGFPAGSYADRPAAVDEVTVRSRDAYAALAYLQKRQDIDPSRVALMGWSNGGSAVLAAMAEPAPGRPAFRAGVALYPGCGLRGRHAQHYRAAAPVRIFIGDADEEVSARACLGLVETARRDGSDVAIEVHSGAGHGFDDPGGRRQSVSANAAAWESTTRAATAFLRERLGTPSPAQ